jgi:hypothetical protein
MVSTMSKKSANIVAGVKASLNIEPEYLDAQGIGLLFGIKHGLVYELLNDGVIESVSLRRRGQTRGKRLFSVESVRRFLELQKKAAA